MAGRLAVKSTLLSPNEPKETEHCSVPLPVPAEVRTAGYKRLCHKYEIEGSLAF